MNPTPTEALVTIRRLQKRPLALRTVKRDEEVKGRTYRNIIKDIPERKKEV